MVGWVTPCIVVHGHLRVVECRVLSNSANRVYYVPGTFPGPGNEM